MTEYHGPDHVLTVTTYPPYRWYNAADGVWTDVVDVDHDLQHPAECDALKYGQLCSLDRLLENIGWDDVPNLDGVYVISDWASGPDHNGEYDAGLTIEKQAEPTAETAVA